MKASLNSGDGEDVFERKHFPSRLLNMGDFKFPRGV